MAIARALAADPPILLMDEPFAAIDPVVREKLQDELLQLQQRLHKTIVLVTHDINEAIRLGDKMAIFQEGGVLAQFDTPDSILAQPASEFVARFIGPEPNLKRLARLQVGQLPRHDVPLVDEELTPISSQHPLVASPLRLVLDKQLRPLYWLDPERRTTLPVSLTLKALHSLRFAYSALLDAPGECWCTSTETVSIRAAFPTGCCSAYWTGMWMFAAMIDWQWIADNQGPIAALFWQHTQLVAVSLFFGTALTGVLIGLTLRWPASAPVLLGLCGVLFTIPSLALFILLIPFTGLSLTTSVIGLTLYSLLILLRNVVAGIEKLPSDVLESARALGYTRWYRFVDVELHLILRLYLPGCVLPQSHSWAGHGYGADWSGRSWPTAAVGL